MKKLCFITLFLVFLLSSISCTTKVQAPKEDEIEIANTEPVASQLTSPYTGETLKSNIYTNTAFMAIIENSKSSRPQSGLNEADIVFETLAEGGIPRFIALFHKNSPNVIGPIRSVRPYFIDIAKDFNIPFAHCGGSTEGLNIIKNESLMSLNEMQNGKYYWRDKKRKAPHNLYTSASKLRDLIDNKNFSPSMKSFLVFDNKYWDNNSLENASSIKIKVSPSYTTSYNFTNNSYTKYIDGNELIDKEDSSPISFDNIVIQLTSIKLSNDNLHVNIDLSSTGPCYVLSKGKIKKGIWVKDSLSNTILIDDKGNPIPLSSGKTWWNIFDSDSTINIEN